MIEVKSIEVLKAEAAVIGRQMMQYNDMANKKEIAYDDYAEVMRPLFAADREIQKQIKEMEAKQVEETAGFANRLGYSDVYPYEIVKRVSEKTIEVRAMNAELCKEWKPEFYAGGFAGHCANQREQKWIYEANEEAPVIRIRKGKRGWKDKHGNEYRLAEAPYKFHDYNF